MTDKKFELIKLLVAKVADYEGSLGASASFDLQDFAEYLLHRQPNWPKKRRLAGKLEPEMQKNGDRAETNIAILVTFMHRYAKLHARKVFAESKISGMDDFSYLIVLVTHENMTKSELIRKNVHEKATGMEIINRLLRQKLVKQTENTDDKRSKRLSITSGGREAVFKLLRDLDDFSMLITADLSEQEKELLQGLLQKLDRFHYEIYLNEKDAGVTDLVDRKIRKVTRTVSAGNV